MLNGVCLKAAFRLLRIGAALVALLAALSACGGDPAPAVTATLRATLDPRFPTLEAPLSAPTLPPSYTPTLTPTVTRTPSITPTPPPSATPTVDQVCAGLEMTVGLIDEMPVDAGLPIYVLVENPTPDVVILVRTARRGSDAGVELPLQTGMRGAFLNFAPDVLFPIPGVYDWRVSVLHPSYEEAICVSEGSAILSQRTPAAIALEALSELVAPEATPEATIEATPEITPEQTPESTREATPEITPRAEAD